ncbi:integrase domain-containing protein [Erwinia sp. P6884]|uniref:integrase domain-containing protein n=1 Tax=Erwinia sp. P6884 TaxID=3141450 RepID=UPI0031967B14
MSRTGREMKQLSKQAGGSHKTVHDRIRIADRFCNHLLALNIQIRSVQYLKTRHIESYIAARCVQGIALRTLQNEMAALRSVLHQAGREKLVASARLTNRALGLSGSSRAGTKFAIPTEKYQQAINQARQLDEGLAIALQLSRLLGLRSQEAVQCSASLKTWQKQLGHGAERLSVVFGTKGGRPRETRILDRAAVSNVIAQALVIAKQRNGKLIDRADLKTAMNYWRSATTRIGLIGSYSPHSLRYAWAQDAIRFYQEQGFSRKEANALTSMDLGHGDGRGRYVERVYGLQEVQA